VEILITGTTSEIEAGTIVIVIEIAIEIQIIIAIITTIKTSKMATITI